MANVGILMPILTLDGGLMFVEELSGPFASCFISDHMSQ